MTTEEQLQRLITTVESLASSVIAHDNQIDAHTLQIGALIDLAATQQKQIGAHDAQIAALLDLAEKHAQSTANLEKQWRAYINTLPHN